MQITKGTREPAAFFNTIPATPDKPRTESNSCMVWAIGVTVSSNHRSQNHLSQKHSVQPLCSKQDHLHLCSYISSIRMETPQPLSAKCTSIPPPHSKKLLSSVQMKCHVSNLYPFPLVLPLGTTDESLAPSLLTILTSGIFIHLSDSP